MTVVKINAIAVPEGMGAMLEGLELALLKGVPRAAVRAAFDRLWVTMIEV